MKFTTRAAVGLALLAGMFATAAQAATVATLTDLKLRRGPGTGYAAIVTLPRGTRLNLGDCTQDLNWCKVYWRGREGWASSHFLSEPGADVAEEPRPRRVERYVERVVPRRPTYQEFPDDGDVLIGPSDEGYVEEYRARPRVYMRLGAGSVRYGHRGYYSRYDEYLID